MRKAFISLLLACALACALPFSAAQTQTSSKHPGTRTASQATADTWVERANQWTNELLAQDRPALSDEMLPAVDTQLARIWWKTDPDRARQWLESAAEGVERIPQNEPDKAKAARMNNVVFITTSAAEMHQSQIKDRMIAVVKAAVGSEPDENKQSLLRFTLGAALSHTLVPEDRPDADKVLEVGEQIVQVGDGANLLQVQMRLRQMDPAKADKLLLDAVQAASAQRNPSLLRAVLGTVYPTYGRPPFRSTPPSEQIGPVALKAAVTLMDAQTQLSRRDCDLVRALDRLQEKLAPDQAAVIAVKMRACSKPHAADAMPKFAEGSADVLARSAGTPEARRRAASKNSAAMLAYQKEHDPIRAFEIINSFTNEEKEAFPDWPVMWSRYASMSIDTLLKHGDRAQAEQILESAPSGFRTQAWLDYAEKLDSTGDPNYALVQLAKARAGLKQEHPRLPYVAVEMVNAYLRMAPDQAAAVFREAVTSWNDMGPCVPRTPLYCSGDFAFNLSPAVLSDKILDVDPAQIQSAISEMTNAKGRATVRLGLIHTALLRHENNQKQAVSAMQ